MYPLKRWSRQSFLKANQDILLTSYTCQFRKHGFWWEMTGGADRDRTGDLMNAIHALYQLSYSPIKI